MGTAHLAFSLIVIVGLEQFIDFRENLMKSTFIKQWAKAVLNNLGYEVRKKGSAEATRDFFPSEPFEAQFQLINRLNNSDKGITIFDIGAHKGQTAIKYRSQFPNAEIYCFEPFPDSIAQLQKRVSDDRRIHIIQKAVDCKKSNTSFYVNGFDETNSLFSRPLSERRYYPKNALTQKVIKVGTIDIDGFVKENDITNIDILKLDIQGGELNALRGAEFILKTGHVSLIYTEISFISHYENSPLFYEVWSFLSKLGYSLFEIYDLCRATNGQIRYGNALFVSEFIRNSVIDRYPDEP